ncbi:MAG TPA: hypothetical protein VFE30_12045 [Anaeromyxobacteraceae bacterium]|nr:hypothetical protein [Anaeromyxobacteraceae bacterium]
MLRSPGFARATLVYLASYAGVGAWLPRARLAPVPGWAHAIGLEAPFSSPLFLVGCAALFASTCACTWGKASRARRIFRGELPPGSTVLRARTAADLEAFLRQRGFRGQGPVRRRLAAGLWGSWLLHAGLLVLMVGALGQQAFYDGGSFELAPGEALRLDEPGRISARSRGLLAPAQPPALEVVLREFDPRHHEPGYAPDRRSLLAARLVGSGWRSAALDRAQGLDLEGGVRLYQANPTGLALVLSPAEGPLRSVHLHGTGRIMEGALPRPGAEPLRFEASSERGLLDPDGTGAIRVLLRSGEGTRELRPGETFAMGGGWATLLGMAWWSGFSYARSPGMPAVLAGFGLILLGCAALVLPAGVARLGGGEARLFAVRGGEQLRSEWERWAPGRRGSGDA